MSAISYLRPENEINILLVKAWSAIDRLAIIWKFDLFNKIKQDFFHSVAVSILHYGCTIWMLMKHIEKSYMRTTQECYIQCAILIKSCKQHPHKTALYGYLPPISQTIQVRQTIHSKYCWRSKDKIVNNILLWTPTHGHAFVVWPAKTCIHQVCMDTGFGLEDLPGAIHDRDWWQEQVTLSMWLGDFSFFPSIQCLHVIGFPNANIKPWWVETWQNILPNVNNYNTGKHPPPFLVSFK